MRIVAAVLLVCNSRVWLVYFMVSSWSLRCGYYSRGGYYSYWRVHLAVTIQGVVTIQGAVSIQGNKVVDLPSLDYGDVGALSGLRVTKSHVWFRNTQE